MSIVLSLALSMKRMLATNNLVRKMHACETMGAVSVICTDKTGTLTQNQMQVAQADFWALDDRSLFGSELGNLIREGIAVNSTAFLDMTDGQKPKVIGNPTEGALLLWLKSQGENYLELRESASVVDQLTFSTERKYMATVVQSPLLNHRVLYVKGAPEYVMNFCSDRVTSSGNVPMTDSRPMLEEKLLQYQNQAMRTLGFAYALVVPDEVCFIAGHLAPHIKLTFLGIPAIADPVRKEVPAAVSDCLNAGIKVKIVTGDTPATAREIARQISLWTPEDGDRNIITGPEFAALDDKTLLERIPDLKVIARARPMDKERLVRLLQSQDEVVAVTGDGTNDAPALAQADVAFHDVIYQATNNERLIQLLNNLREQMYRYRIEYLKDVKSRRSLVEEHDALYERMKNRDLAGAQKMIREHIERQQESIMQTVHHQSMTGVEEK